MSAGPPRMDAGSAAAAGSHRSRQRRATRCRGLGGAVRDVSSAPAFRCAETNGSDSGKRPGRASRLTAKGP
jgi:hypothetical protein